MNPEHRTPGEKALVVVGVIFVVLFCLVPLLPTILTSVSVHPGTVTGIQDGVTLESFREVLTSRSLRFSSYLRNSCIISGLAAILALAVAAPAAFAFNSLPLPRKRTLLLGILAVSMFPQICLVGGLYKGLADLKMLNTYTALVLPYAALCMPLLLYVLLSYFRGIPSELEAAARVDGARSFTVFRRVVVPLALPGLLSAAILGFVQAFNEFLFALVLTTNHAARTVSVGLALFEGLHGQVPWGQISAAAIIASTPAIVLALFFQRHIVEGLTRGSVKG